MTDPGAQHFNPLDPPLDENPRRRYDAFISYSHRADQTLAPRLQRGLERMAKPLLKLKAVDIFRDGTGLGAGGELWPDIARPMDGSEYLILLCSVAAATVAPDKPDWVGREITRWRANKGVDRIILVLTDGPTARSGDDAQGGLKWDEKAGDFDRAGSPSLHPSLFGAFPREPFFIDLSYAHGEPGNALTTREVGLIAARLRGKTPGDLFGEDRRIRRRTRGLIGTAVIALAGLTVAALVAGGIAVANEREATEQRAAADSRALAAQSQNWTGPRALLLAAEAQSIADTKEAKSALLRAIDDPVTADDSDDRWLTASFTHDGRSFATRASVDGSMLATLDESGLLNVWASKPQAPRTVIEITGDSLAWSGTESIAVIEGSQLTWVDPVAGTVGESVDLGEEVSAVASGTDGALVGTVSGAVARVALGDAVESVPGNLQSVTFVGESDAGIVSVDTSARIVTRDLDTLEAGNSVTGPTGTVTDLSDDGASVLGIFTNLLSAEALPLAAVIDVATGETVGELRIDGVASALDAVFGSVSSEDQSVSRDVLVLADTAVFTLGADPQPEIFRGTPSPEGEIVVPQSRVVSLSHDDFRVALPAGARAFVRDVALQGDLSGQVGVAGSGATVFSTEAGDELLWDQSELLPTALSVSPATGMALVRDEGLALANLGAVASGPLEWDEITLTSLSVDGTEGWLSPDGGTVLFHAGGVGALMSTDMSTASPEGWTVLPFQPMIEPAAALDGSQIAYGVQTLTDEGAIIIVDAATGAIVSAIEVPDALCSDGTCAGGTGSRLALSPDGRYLAVRTAEVSDLLPTSRPAQSPTVIVYDVTEPGEFTVPQLPPVDDWLATGFPDGTIDENATVGVEIARFSAADTTVPTFGADGLLRFHDGGQSILTVDPEVPEDATASVSLAGAPWVLDENGTPVAAAGCAITVLDASSQPATAPSTPGGCTDRRVAWISGSKSLVVDGSSILPTDSDRLSALACELAGRNFTAAEWQQFLGNETYRAVCPDGLVPERTGDIGLLPSAAPSVPLTEDDFASLDRIIVQPGLPDPPNVVGDGSDFVGRDALLEFLRYYFGADMGDATAEAQACVLPPVAPVVPAPPPKPTPPAGSTPEPVPTVTEEPWERVRCVGVIRVDDTSMVIVDFVGDVPEDWALLEVIDGVWDVAASYNESEGTPAPAWVKELLRD